MTSVEQLVSILIDKKISISAAESCTGGMFISKLIDCPGTSEIIGASFVTYSDSAKIKIVGVNVETINEFGVVSENVAIEMAKGARRVAETQIGVGITGIAGPPADENDNTVGTVCFGFDVIGKTVSATKHFGNIGRNAVRELSCIYAVDTLIRLLSLI